MTLNLEYEAEIELNLDYRSIITKVVEKALDLEECPYEVELNVILTDNEEIREINQTYRTIDAPTDVLSFPMIGYETPGDFDGLEEAQEDYFNPETGELLLGDIIISVEKVIEQAKEYGHTRERELAFLTAHSMMHLFGYDHMEENERIIMEEKQKKVLDELTIFR
ncbi:rRNA maturation RNase YbeY [Anaerocolumna sp. AGMB13025]|jgi:probable rRNA maturation factor|uniref:rRNA maturation RNase YbeY n=1 Tax=Anaerocolumna sp. AGMB13025 TaxID=3039116 RepID=UPI00241D985E|nr:rRNA maturation RNase YbeY [Anaerocolumna sp. AGMB13025]WFR59977.1 rRNA maturation RNase YbeY [Anaerocolumna sp. AGMB13025]